MSVPAYRWVQTAKGRIIVRIEESVMSRLWDEAKHPRNHGEFSSSPGTVGSRALGNRRVVGSPGQEAARGARNARMARLRGGLPAAPQNPGARVRATGALRKQVAEWAKNPPEPPRTKALPEGVSAAPDPTLHSWPEPSDLTKAEIGKAKDTREVHTDSSGAYTAERKALHDAIIAHYLDGVEPAPINGKPEALFLAGGPASGKSSALAAAPELKPKNAVTINPDDIKELLPEYRKLVEGGDRYAAQAGHEESSDIAKRLTVEAMKRGLNVVIDGTGDSGKGKFVGKIVGAQRAGYRARALYVTAPTDDAIGRAIKRAERSGRFVPVPELRAQHARVSENFSDVQALRGLHSLDVIDTGAGKGKEKHVFTMKNGKAKVLDEKGHKAFLAKAREALQEAVHKPKKRRVAPPKREPFAPPAKADATKVKGEGPGDSTVAPENWIVFPVADSADWLGRPMPTYQGEESEDIGDPFQGSDEAEGA